MLESRYDGKGVKVAVIDSGIHMKHPHIFARTTAISGNFTELTAKTNWSRHRCDGGDQERAPDARILR